VYEAYAARGGGGANYRVMSGVCMMEGSGTSAILALTARRPLFPKTQLITSKWRIKAHN